MTQQEIFEATTWNKVIKYQDHDWLIQSTYSDDTADLVRKNRMGNIESTNAPFTLMKLA